MCYLVCLWVLITSGCLYEQLCECERFELFCVNEINSVIILILTEVYIFMLGFSDI